MLASVSFFQAAWSCFTSQTTPPSALDKGHSIPMASVDLKGKKERKRKSLKKKKSHETH
jgi:hypothetical protein